MEVRRLERADDRAGFRSGNDSLDEYFHRYAGQNQFRHGVSVSYVAVAEGEIVGFASVSAGSVDAREMPRELFARIPYSELPILRLGRLAVSQTGQRSGVGTALLYRAMETTVQVSRLAGCSAMVVDAKPDAVGFYRKHGLAEIGEHKAPEETTLMAISVKQIERLMAEPQP